MLDPDIIWTMYGLANFLFPEHVQWTLCILPHVPHVQLKPQLKSLTPGQFWESCMPSSQSKKGDSVSGSWELCPNVETKAQQGNWCWTLNPRTYPPGLSRMVRPAGSTYPVVPKYHIDIKFTYPFQSGCNVFICSPAEYGSYSFSTALPIAVVFSLLKCSFFHGYEWYLILCISLPLGCSADHFCMCSLCFYFFVNCLFKA